MLRHSALVAALEKVHLEQWLPLRNPDTFPQSPHFIEESYVLLGRRRPMMQYVQEAHKHFSKINNSRSKVKPIVRWRRSRPSIDVGCVSYSSADTCEKKPEIQRLPLVTSEPIKASADVITGQLHVGSSSGRQTSPRQHVVPPSSEAAPSTTHSNSNVEVLPKNVFMVVDTEQGKVLVSLPPQSLPTPLDASPPSNTIPPARPAVANLPRSLQAVISTLAPCNAKGLNPMFQSPYAHNNLSVPPAYRNLQQQFRYGKSAPSSCTRVENPLPGQTSLRLQGTQAIKTLQPGPDSFQPTRTKAVRTAQPGPAFSNPTWVQAPEALPHGSVSLESRVIQIAKMDFTGDSNLNSRTSPSSENHSSQFVPGRNSTIVLNKERSKPALKGNQNLKSSGYQSARRTTGPPKTRLTIREMKTLYCPVECYVRLERIGLATIRRLCKSNKRQFSGEVGKKGQKLNREKSSSPRLRKPTGKPKSRAGGAIIVPKLKISLKHLNLTEGSSPVPQSGLQAMDDCSSEKENFPADIEGSKMEVCQAQFKRCSSPLLDPPPEKKIGLSLLKYFELKTGELSPTEENKPYFVKSEDSKKNLAFSGSFFSMAMPDVNLNYKVPTDVVADGELNLKSLECSDFNFPPLKVTMKNIDSWINLYCKNCNNTFPTVEEWSCHYSEGCASREAADNRRSLIDLQANPVI